MCSLFLVYVIVRLVWTLLYRNILFALRMKSPTDYQIEDGVSGDPTSNLFSIFWALSDQRLLIFTPNGLHSEDKYVFFGTSNSNAEHY